MFVATGPVAAEYDAEQRGVIDAPVGARILVEAPPGTGKTATACARVAQLLAAGVAPPTILLVSFTRTAVAELRARIRALAKSVEAADAVRIATLDAEAWRLRYGFGVEEGNALFGGFDEGISKVLGLLAAPSDEVLDYFERTSHLLVDEAQDLTDQRAALVLRIIDLLPDAAGITVFGDPAQAIYGWTGADDESDEPDRVTPNLLQMINRKRFATRVLSTIYRTKDAALVALFKAARTELQQVPPATAPARMLQLIRAHTGKPPDALTDEITYGDPTDCDDVLLLFRTRVEVLRQSADLLRLGRAHRVRLPGYGRWLMPELAGALANHVGKTIDGDTFLELCGPQRAETCRAIWPILRACAPADAGRADIKGLSQRLARNPPDELLVRDGGWTGPTLSTIHASKGREAKRVVLSIAARGQSVVDDAAALQEARVLYVAATRAHDAVWHVDSEFRPTTKTACGRSFVMARGGVLIEVGLDGDVEFRPPETSDAIRTWLQTLSAVALGDELFAVKEGPPWSYRLYSPQFPSQGLGTLAPKVDNDLWDCARIAHSASKPSGVIANLFVVGFQSMFLLSDKQTSEANSGAFIAPVIRGFPYVSFQVPNK